MYFTLRKLSLGIVSARETFPEFMRSAPSLPVITAAMIGVLASLQWLTHAVLPNPSESRDWLFFFAVVLVSPAALVFLRRPSVRAFFLAAAFAHVAFLLASGIPLFADALAQRVSPAIGSRGVFLLIAVAAAALNLFLTCWLYRFLEKDMTHVERMAGIVALYCLLMMNSDDAPFFWARQEKLAPLLYVVFFLLAYRRLFTIAPVTRSRPGLAIIGWILLYVLYSQVPFQSCSVSLYHHWSYYLGPIESIKRGGLLLYDTPSQYGLLSIWVPAWLPFSSATSFHLVLSTILLIQALLTYRIYLNCPWIGSSRFLPGVLSFATTYLIPAMRDPAFGAFDAPSTTGYRFIWAFALTVILVKRAGTDSSIRRSMLIALLFSVGSLWSFESFFYCTAVLGAAVAGELATSIIDKKSPWIVVRWCLWPLATLACSVIFIEIVYRLRLGVTPEWFAFIEYATIYQGGFGALPINALGALNSWLAIQAMVFALLFCGVRLGGAAACWAFLMSTFTYYVSRSHPSNLVNLFALCIPILCLLVSQPKLAMPRLQRIRPLLGVSVLLVLIIGFPKPIPLLLRLGDLAWKFPGNDIESNLARAKGPADRRRLAILHELAPIPTVDFTGILPELSAGNGDYVPLLPIYPISHFAILPPDRRRIYLERHLQRNRPARIQILSVPGGSWLDLETTLLPVIRSHYVVGRTRMVGGLTLSELNRESLTR